MLSIHAILLPLDGDEATLKKLCAKRLGLPVSKIKSVRLTKRSVDARKRSDIHFICNAEVSLLADEEKILQKQLKGVAKAVPYLFSVPKSAPLPARPVVVGTGPAGLFAALILAEAGQRPIVLERGAPVDERRRAVELFWQSGQLDTHTNVQFGEGGAGTFSDGKLGTGIVDAHIRKVYEEFVSCGAPPEILYEKRPHIGTDRLRETVKNLREKIISLGGDVFFHTQLTDIQVKDGQVSAAITTGAHDAIIPTRHVILAIGHSARDTFQTLFDRGIAMTQKPFAIGVRIEHLQEAITQAQYGTYAAHPALPVADYKLAVETPSGSSVYTFCMCPGGTVVSATSEEGQLTTNGMSEYARDGRNANSALLVSVNEADFGDKHPLSGIAFQRKIERAAFLAGGGGYHAPVQRVEDFLQHQNSTRFGDVLPTYLPGTTFSQMDDVLPERVCQALRGGIVNMNRYLKGFSHPDAILTGAEVRSSSPVRIVRGDDRQSIGLKGLFPCGEGAGYAGGITSAAVDGIKCALALLEQENN